MQEGSTWFASRQSRRSSSSRRAVLIGVVSVAVLAAPTPASALGPGGWGNLGDRGPTLPTFSALDGRVDALNTDMPGKLIAGGAFTAAGVPAGATAADDHIAVWNGTSWSPLGAGAGLSGDVHALAFMDGKIYAGGIFANAGGNADADALAVWDTNAGFPSWQPICSPAPVTNANVEALEIVGNTLYIGSTNQNWGGIAAADYLIACDLTSGTPTAMVATDGHATSTVKALAADSAGDLYAGGNFTDWATITTADYVVKYDLPAGTPSALGVNAINTVGVDSLATLGTDLYVGTDDVNVDGIAQADNIVKWNGSAWSAAGANTAGDNGYFGTGLADVQALTVSGSTVFASGNWSNANGEPLADGVARFDASCVPVAGVETCWDNVGSNGALNNGPLSGNLHRGLAVFNNSLVAGGNFADAGGDPLADSIACFPLAGATSCILPGGDTTAPDTTITKSSIRKAMRKAKFTFISSEQKPTFSCKLDKKPFKDCPSPKSYKDLKKGKHTFQVRAADLAGNIDKTPAKRNFKI